MFKSLIFVQGLTTKNEKEIRTRLLSLTENDMNITTKSYGRMSETDKNKTR